MPIHVYYEGIDPPDFQHELVNWVELDTDTDRQAFIGNYGDKISKDYRKNAIKFCHKVFALTNLLNQDYDWVIWLDADIETHEKIDEGFLESICPKGFVGSYLGRRDWDHSECGFVAFDLNSGGREFLEKFREYYTSGRIFHEDQWHDSWIFDLLRSNARLKSDAWWYNLSADIRGMNVFDDSILGTKMRHYKGPLRKAGKDLSSTPEGYMSKKEAKEAKASGIILPDEQQALYVKTKNCVPEKNIQANIHYSSSLLGTWIRQTAQHDRTAIFCSGGPSLSDYFDEIKKINRRKSHYLVCVKHSHDTLIEHNIIPWACILLDPRAHVQDFIENPHPDVIYFVSSMVHPTTIDRLLEREANVWGYHAIVGAGEQEIISDRLGDKHFLLSGGCSAAMRGISLLHCLGFRKFLGYGYDLCYFEKPDMTELNKRGEPKYLKVEVHGRTFYTDAEKVAQCQDFARLLKETELGIEMIGPGMVPHVWQAERKMLPEFEQVFNG